MADGGGRGRLVYLAAPRQIEFQEYDLPEPEPGGILARVIRANVCGSELHIWKGLHPTVQRCVMGHEMVGRVEALGAGVETDYAGEALAPGTRIVAAYFLTCRKCRACRRGQFNLCENAYRFWMRSPREAPHFHGTFATHYCIHPDQYVYRVPDNVPDAVASFANCALSQVSYGLDLAGLALGETLVIQGAGGLGLAAIAVAKERGARVIAIDGVGYRLEAAEAFGADEIVDLREHPTPADRAAEVLRLTDDWGADVGIELTGVPAAFGEGIALVRPGGRYVSIGNISPGQLTPFDPGALNRRQVQIIPVIRYQPWYLRKVLQLLAATIDRYPWQMLVDTDFAFEDAGLALEKSERREVRRASIVMP
ncbi:MAG TPA: zinc-binding dehydrogenase [Thermomicrobiales bacterium]|nr:zinc-binding dehydrogenase [Thermomicrobiales bacterium]